MKNNKAVLRDTTNKLKWEIKHNLKKYLSRQKAGNRRKKGQ